MHGRRWIYSVLVVMVLAVSVSALEPVQVGEVKSDVGVPLLLGQPAMTPMTPAQPDTTRDRWLSEMGFGSCYVGCATKQFSSFLCAPGQVAELIVDGPTFACGLNSFQCKSSCSGPVVQCTQFSNCNPV